MSLSLTHQTAIRSNSKVVKISAESGLPPSCPPALDRISSENRPAIWLDRIGAGSARYSLEHASGRHSTSDHPRNSPEGNSAPPVGTPRLRRPRSVSPGSVEASRACPRPSKLCRDRILREIPHQKIWTPNRVHRVPQHEIRPPPVPALQGA